MERIIIAFFIGFIIGIVPPSYFDEEGKFIKGVALFKLTFTIFVIIGMNLLLNYLRI